MKRALAILLLLVSAMISDRQPPAHASSARETEVVKVVRQWAPSVVNISTERIAYLRRQPFWRGYGDNFDAMFRDFFQQSTVSAVKLPSVGSGVVVGEDGLIVTNAHVVNMANRLYVIFSNRKAVKGGVVVVNQKDDIAFIKVDPPQLVKPVALADADSVMIGETVIAIGNPFGLENSVSVGVVSGKNRSFVLPSRHVFTDLIQTDASVNLGSSGGALLNLEGELVGINLAVVQNAQNIGFAISPRKIKEGLAFYEEEKKRGQRS